jgi:FkbM family methyltransferase
MRQFNYLKLIYFNPFVKPTPIWTFPQRAFQQWRKIISRVVVSAELNLGIGGAHLVGNTPEGNSILKLNKDYALGNKGTLIQLPKDRNIYHYVRTYGSWELELCKFLSKGLRAAYFKNNSTVVLLDIGANTGLVSLQTMNLSGTTNEVFLVEPIKRNISAIKNNLNKLQNVHIHEFALSDKNGKAEIMTDFNNFGNSSYLSSAFEDIDYFSTPTALVSTAEYCKKFLNNFDSYVIKCDTQGMDALILSRFPEQIWQKCQSAVIEVWALPNINKTDVQKLLSMCKGFDKVSWNPHSGKAKKLGFDEIIKFWTNKSGATRNLFLSK